MHSSRVSERQERRICDLIRHSGLTYAQIGRQFGMSDSSVYRIAHRNGLAKPRNPWTPEEIQFLKDNYWELGATGIANVMPTHANRQTVCRMARSLGLRTKVGPYGKKRGDVADG